jgi:hypothetical protein
MLPVRLGFGVRESGRFGLGYKESVGPDLGAKSHTRAGHYSGAVILFCDLQHCGISSKEFLVMPSNFRGSTLQIYIYL